MWVANGTLKECCCCEQPISKLQIFLTAIWLDVHNDNIRSVFRVPFATLWVDKTHVCGPSMDPYVVYGV